jgi:hypothetical protein
VPRQTNSGTSEGPVARLASSRMPLYGKLALRALRGCGAVRLRTNFYGIYGCCFWLCDMYVVVSILRIGCDIICV